MKLDNIKLTVLPYLFSFLLSINTYAQKESKDVVQAYSPHTPEASRLIRDIQYPATYNHGMVNISIPLFEIKEGDITLPIYLSYNHKGVKYSEYNLELGQGWSLNAVPAIYYNINGALDTQATLTAPREDRYPTSEEKRFLYEGSRDQYPDSYFYKLADRSGSFFLDPAESNKPKTYEFDPIRIKNINNEKIVITDDNGIIYTFSEREYTLTSPNKWGRYCSGWKATSITSPSKNNSIEFEYKIVKEIKSSRSLSLTIADAHEQYFETGYPKITSSRSSGGTYRETIAYIEDLYYEPENGPIPGWSVISKESNSSHDAFMTSIFPGEEDLSSHIKTEHEKQCISSIKWAGGKVIFNYSGDILSEIIIYDTSGDINKQCTLKNTVVTLGANTTKYPMLSELIISGYNNDKALEHYYFDYYSECPYPQQQGATANFWGYANGSDQMYGSMGPSITNFIVSKRNTISNSTLYLCNGWVGGMDKQNPASNKGVLHKIRNIIGGYVEFVYESDMYMQNTVRHYDSSQPTKTKVIQEERQTGGLRIKEVIYGENKALNQYNTPILFPIYKRVFKYGQEHVSINVNKPESDYDGVGLVKADIGIETYMTSKQIKNINYIDRPSDVYVRTYHSSLLGNLSYNGIPIVYDRVTEYVQGYEDSKWVNRGKTTYKYQYRNRIVPDNYFITLPYLGSGGEWRSIYTGIIADPHDDWRHGQLISTETYKGNGSDYTLISKKDYQYKTFDDPLIKIGQVAEISRTYDRHEIERGKNPVSEFHYYVSPIYRGCTRISMEVDSTFTEKGNIGTLTEYQYHNRKHLYPTVIKKTQSDGSVVTQTLKYPQDNLSANIRTDFAAVNNLLDNWIIKNVLEEEIITKSGTNKTFNMYKLDYNSKQAVLSSKDSSRDNNPLEQRIVYKRHDKYNNPLEIIKDNAESVVLIWSHGGSNLIAEIRNTSSEEVSRTLDLGQNGFDLISSYTSPSSISKITKEIDALRDKLPNAHVTSYTYKPLVGIQTSTDPSGLTIYYDYDSNGRLKRTFFKETLSNGKIEEKVIQTYDYNYSN